MKTCSKCSEEKSLSEFVKDSRAKDGHSYYCRACKKAGRKKYLPKVPKSKEYSKRYRTENAERIRLYQIKLKYGLEPEAYVAMLAKGCAVCGSMENLCVDHDHNCCSGKTSCGKCVRGILCRSCNNAEGYLKSNPDLARKLADYLER